MKTHDLIQHYLPQIQHIKIFSYLTYEELFRITKNSQIITYQDGDIIINQGDTSQHVYVVLEGMVEVYVLDEDEKIFICTVEPGEMFGEAAIFMSVKRTASVISSGQSTLIQIHRKDILTFFREKPQSANKMLMLIICGLLQKLKETNHEIALEEKTDLNLDEVDILVHDLMFSK